MDFALLSWLFVAAVTLHNIEEAVWLPAWTKGAGVWHRAVGAREFRLAVVVLTALAVFAAWLAGRQGKLGPGAYLLCGYALAMLLNVLVPHLLATFVTRRYVPGTATAVLLNLPVSAALLYRALEEGYVARDRFMMVGPLVVAGIVASIPILFWIGRRA